MTDATYVHIGNSHIKEGEIPEDLWSDSDCEVSQEYSCSSDTKSPHSTYQFDNTLIKNKGNISTARILWANKAKSVTPNSPKNCDSSVEYSVDGIFIIPKVKSSLSKKRKLYAETDREVHLSKLSEKTPTKANWKKVYESKKMISSPKLLSSMRN